MKKKMIVLMMLAIAFCSGCGIEERYEASKRTEAVLYTEQGDRNANPSGPTDLAFVGDSITYAKMWQTEWPEKNVANYGISGSTTEKVIANMNGYQSSKDFIVLIGINDFLRGEGADFFDRYKLIITTLKAKSERVYCGSILPINHDVEHSVAPLLDTVPANLILYVNVKLEKVCIDNGGIFINTYAWMLEPGTLELQPMWTTDGLHLNSMGYKQYVRAIKSVYN